MQNEFAESVIDRVHALWESHSKEYPAGYAVFYGPVRYMPDLLLIGLNPGGDERCFHGKKEVLCSVDKHMEYLEYRNCSTYRIAGKTVNLFESANLLNILETSVKINLNFFRSIKWTDLSMQHTRTCLDLVLELVETLKPKVIFCESLFVFDVLQKELENSSKYTHLSKQNNSRNRRIYVSITQGDFAGPSTIIGITHLTGSRPSKADIQLIGQTLEKDLCRTNASTGRL